MSDLAPFTSMAFRPLPIRVGLSLIRMLGYKTRGGFLYRDAEPSRNAPVDSGGSSGLCQCPGLDTGEHLWWCPLNGQEDD